MDFAIGPWKRNGQFLSPKKLSILLLWVQFKNCLVHIVCLVAVFSSNQFSYERFTFKLESHL